MNSGVQTPPRTMMEVYKMLPEGTLAELIDNILYMSPSPLTNHQRILQFLFRRLSEKITDPGRGEVFFAPFDVYLDEESNAVQPDLIVVLRDNAHIVDPNSHIHGVPDFLIEILSPSNRNHDLIKKKNLYEKFGVKEYWVIDPTTKLTIGYFLANNKFIAIPEKMGIISSSLLNLEIPF